MEIKNSSGTLNNIKNIIYWLPEKKIFLNYELSSDYLIKEVDIIVEGVSKRILFDNYDLSSGEITFSVIDGKTGQINLNRQVVTLDEKAKSSILLAQNKGQLVAKGGRIAASTDCDQLSSAVKASISVFSCVYAIPGFATALTAALAAAPGTLGISAALATLAGIGLIISCAEAGKGVADEMNGRCDDSTDIPQNILDCTITALTIAYSRDYKDLADCLGPVADALRGLLTPKEKEPEPNESPDGRSTGDPHLTTSDNFDYDFHGHGEFIAAKSTTDNFEVQVRQEDFNNSGVATLNTAVAIQTGSDVVCITVKPDQIYINNTSRDMNFTTLPLKNAFITKKSSDGLTSFDVTTRNGDVVRVRFHNGYLLDYLLYLKDNRKGNIVGLMGNFDGNSNNDLQIRNGGLIKNEFAQLYPNYADSWRVPEQGSLFYYPAGKNTLSYTKRDFPKAKPIHSVDAMQRAEAICRAAGITTEPNLNNCILDVIVTGDDLVARSSALAQLTDASPTPSITKIIDDNLYTATYVVDKNNLILTVTGSGTYYPSFNVDINQNGIIDKNVDKSYGVGEGTNANGSKFIFLCSQYLIDYQTSSTCGVAPTTGTISKNGNTYTISIPISELDPTSNRKQIAVIADFYSTSDGYKYYPGYNNGQYFAKTIMLTVR